MILSLGNRVSLSPHGSEAVTESLGNAMIDLGQLAQEPPSGGQGRAEERSG